MRSLALTGPLPYEAVIGICERTETTASCPY